MNYFNLLTISLLLKFTSLTAQVGVAEAGYVHFGGISEVSVQVGDTVHLNLAFEIQDGFHIQSNKVSGDFLIPTKIALAGNGLALEEPVFSATHPFVLGDSDETKDVFTGKFFVGVSVFCPDNSTIGSHAINGTLYYQACNDFKCFFPRKLKFETVILVEPDH